MYRIHNNIVLDIVRAAGMDETYGTYIDDECFDIHDHDDETDHDPNDDTDEGGRGNLYPIKVQG